jgi:hypothetical protein
MPTLATIGKLKVQMFYGDHNPPHVHVYGGGYAALIRIEDGELLAGRLPYRARHRVLSWVAENREELMRVWVQYRAG